MRRQIAAAAGVLLLAACANRPPPLDVERQWRESIASLGMFAIYPPSEDVMVGDAFLYVPNAAYFDLVRITAAPRQLLARQLCFQEEDRLVVDTREGASGLVHPNVECRREQVARQRRVAVFNETAGPEHATRLREAAIPTLEVGRFSQGEIAGAGILGNFSAALGIGFSRNAAVRVELGELQGVTLDEVRGSRLVQAITIGRVEHATAWATLPRNRRDRPETEDFPNALTPLMLARSLLLADNRRNDSAPLLPRFCRGEFKSLDDDGAQVVVANRLLFANSVTFDFISESVTALRAAMDFAAVMANRTQPTTTPALSQGGGGAAAAGGGPPQGGTPTAGQADLDKEIARLMAITNGILTLPASTPGQVSARLTVGRFGNIALKKDFVRPAAIGMGGALQFSLEDAAMPASDNQVADVLLFCQGHYAMPADALQPLRQRLEANLAWARYLQARADGAPGRMPGAQPTGPARSQLKPLVPGPNVRVRL